MMARMSWIRTQLEAWGHRGVTVAAPEDGTMYLEKKVAEALTEEQIKILGITPVEDHLLDTPRHQIAGKAFKAFKVKA